MRWDDREVRFLSVEDPAHLPWEELEIDIVVEASGLFTREADARKHLDAGADRVILTAPGKGDVVTICPGVNDHVYDPEEHRIVSNASCTTNALAPVAKVLHEGFGIVQGALTTVHAYTSSQGLVDVPKGKWRRGRAAAMNIVPTSTGAAEASGGMEGILGASEEELVSSDIVGNPLSALVDLSSTMTFGGPCGPWADHRHAADRRRAGMRTMTELELKDRTVLVRADFNVPLEEGEVADDTRLRETLPTLEHLLGEGARVVLCSHLGRPEGRPREELRLDPVARRLSEMLGTQVRKLDDCVGEDVRHAIRDMEAGEVLLLENTRFHPGEKENDESFARRLAELADVYVNDAFGAAHRAHASTEGVAHHLPAAAGLLLAREVETLEAVRRDPEHPFVAILGGAKISDKIGVIQKLLDQVDRLLIGGAMANTFLKARGEEVGASLVEEDQLDRARSLLEEGGEKLLLPVDVVVAEEMDADSPRRTVDVAEVPEGWRILDVGPETLEAFQDALEGARTVLWNGPLGAFEVEPFAEGTEALARMLAELGATTIVGGGETASAVARAGVKERLTHVSTGGGAFLEFMEGKELPGVAALGS